MSSQTDTPRPELPVELVEHIFQLLHERLNPNPDRWWETAHINNKTFVKLSLVCKDWQVLAKQFRSVLFIGSEKGAKRFLTTFKRARLSITKLHYGVHIPDDLLFKLLPLLNRKLTALSLPVDMLQSKHAYNLLKNPSTNHPIHSVHVHGKLADDYHTSWWKKAYLLHDIPTLRELSLTGLYIKGIVREISAAVKSPITTLSLERLRFQSSLAVEHLCRPILYDLEDLHVSTIAPDHTRDILMYLSTSWTGLKRLDIPLFPAADSGKAAHPLLLDLSTKQLSSDNSATQEDRLERVQALFKLCRKLKFNTAASVQFVDSMNQICFAADFAKPLPLPSVFNLRKELNEEDTKGFLQAYALLTGTRARPTIVDPPEFFDIYAPYIDSAHWENTEGGWEEVSAGDSW